MTHTQKRATDKDEPKVAPRYKRERPREWLKVLEQEGLLEDEEDASVQDLDGQ